MTDMASGFLRLMTGMLGAGYPMRLYVGVAIGTLIKMFVGVLAFVYPDQVVWHALDVFSLTWYLVIVIPLLFAPLAFGHKGAPESVAHQVKTIELLISQAGFTKVQAALIWKSLIDKYIKAMQPDLSRAPKLADLYKETAKELSDGGGHPS
jgi:hypothetical protein